jgi:hypothetical protein
MPEEASQDHDAPQPTVYEVSDHSAKKVLVNHVRRRLTSIKIRSANEHNDQTRNLLQEFGDKMEPRDKQVIESQLDESV